MCNGKTNDKQTTIHVMPLLRLYTTQIISNDNKHNDWHALHLMTWTFSIYITGSWIDWLGHSDNYCDKIQYPAPTCDSNMNEYDIFSPHMTTALRE